jgi:hypothetical protein
MFSVVALWLSGRREAARFRRRIVAMNRSLDLAERMLSDLLQERAS